MTELHLDLKADALPLEPAWTFGASVSHAPMLLRPDFRRHLLMCRDELGFRHVGCGGILGNDMGAGDQDGTGRFEQVEAAVDWLLENGLTPFIRLTGASIDPGKDSAKWVDMVRALAVHVDGRYGCDAREWYFEVPIDSTAEAHEDAPGAGIYELAAKSIKQVHHEYRVGARADAVMLQRLLPHVTTAPADVPLDAPRFDFISLSPNRGDAGLRALYDGVAAVRELVTSALGKQIPLLLDGWNSARPTNDACDGAATMAAAMVELTPLCQGVLHAGVSDIDCGPESRFEPFHQGCGLVTVNDVRKAAFQACRLLHQHGGYHCQRVPSRWENLTPGLGCLVTRSEYTLRVLAWLEKTTDAGAAPAARFSIEGLPASIREAQVEVIRPAAGSAFEAWTQLGRPPFINREVLDAIETASQPAQAEVDFREYPPRLEPGMVMQLTIQLPFEEMGAEAV